MENRSESCKKGSGHQKVTLVLKNYIVSLTLILCLLASFFAIPVKGQDPLIEESEPIFALEVDEEISGNQSEPLGGSQPYVAGFMTTDYIWGNYPDTGPDAEALRVTVSFSGTDQSVIQSDNFLAAGITAQGPDRHYGSCMAIDWGYIFTLVVTFSGDPFVHAEVWEIHEWGDCTFIPWGKVVSSWNAVIGGLTISSDVTLTMQWSENTLDYYAKVNGGPTLLLYSYTPNATASHYFKTGTVQREVIIPVEYPVKWFQFHGAWSSYNIGQVGWHSHLSYPGYKKRGGSGWYDISFAYSTDGRYAYLDNTVRWGGDYYENVTASHSFKHVHFYPTFDGSTLEPDTILWSPPGGCPYVSTFNGTHYVLDNNLLPASETSNGTDVEDYYKLERGVAPVYQGTLSLYSLRILEFENEHSYLDQTKLMSVDHNAYINVAASPIGEILTYENPCAPLSAVDEQGTSWLEELSDIDGNFYEGYNGSFLILNFGEITTPDAKLVMRADRPPTKYSIHIQVLDSAGNWMDVAAIIPRTYWATEIIDLSSYLPSSGEFKVRLYFTDRHKIDFAGLDTTSQAQIDVEQALLLLAYHSDYGIVTAKLRSDDDIYAELTPGQQITLLFGATAPSGEQRTFIIYTKGYYYAITG